MMILSSPSGAGKTTLTKLLEKKFSNFTISISHTTRKPRPNETDGKDYFFVNENQFQKLINEDFFLEFSKIFNNHYGTAKKSVLEKINKGLNVLFDIDWQGTRQLKKKIKDIKLITVFILPPDIQTLKQRLVNRDQSGKQIAEQRMKKFKEELSHWSDYDYVVVNNDLNACYNEICEIIKEEENNKKYLFDKSKISRLIDELSK
jgi:guanylate kinase